MAEQIPFSIAENLLGKLGSDAFAEIGLMYGVRKELTKLKCTLDTIKAVFVDADEQQQKSEEGRSRAIAVWIRRLKDVVYDADDLLDDFATEDLRRKTDVQGRRGGKVRDFFSSSNHLAFRFKMGHRIKDIRERLDEIAKDMSQFGFTSRVMTVADRGERETHSGVEKCHEIVGRDKSKKEILELLKQSSSHQSLSVVVIVGMGGLGKTTLAQLVYNDRGLVNHFDVKFWVCVSENFDVKIICRNILGSDAVGLDSLRQRLQQKLDGKRYLLVLDDVWNEDAEKWERLRNLLPDGSNGSKILVTTRSIKVASVMGINRPYTLKGLNKGKSWHLFTLLALKPGEEEVRPNLITIGKEIVRMCKGTPLVIKTLGRMLNSETREDAWLRIKNNKNLMSLEDGKILSVLKLSYDALPIHLKQCFTYCALFPKDYQIEKDMLIKLWMAQGYIQSSSEGHLLEDVGEQYFEELLWRSFFQEIKEDDDGHVISCKMHDLIHDLAESLVNNEISILKDGSNNTKTVHHASRVAPVEKWEVLTGKSMRTFLLIPRGRWFPDANHMNISCPYLRVLDLNSSKIVKVPECLGKLIHLRYLDLSSNNFDELPKFITRLHNLQTLKLLGCGQLKELPTDIRKLINLRHLSIDFCGSLSYMPSGLGQLTELQSLPFFLVGEGSGDSSCKEIGSLSELKRLNNLRGELEIRNLENVRDAAVISKEAVLMGKQYLQSLKLYWKHHDREAANRGETVDPLVMEGLPPHPHLKELRIEGYGGVAFPRWMMNDGLNLLLPNLVTIKIWDCGRCQDLPLLDQLPSLEYLELRNLTEVEYMKESSSAMPFFPSLKTLKIVQLSNWKGWWRRGLSFPCLSYLQILNCDELASLGQSSFSYLSHIDISNCHKLTSFGQSSFSCLSSVQIYNCVEFTSLGQSSFPSLSLLKISSCHKLTSLVQSSFPSLSLLKISDCLNLTFLGQSSFPCLSRLEICNVGLTSLGHSTRFPCLSLLHITNCLVLTSFGQSSFPCLSLLNITNCPELTFFTQSSFPCLSCLRISNCGKLTSLSQSSFPCLVELQLFMMSKELLLQPKPVFSSLKMITIERINDLTSLPEEGIGYLTSLRYLHIGCCESLMSLSPGIQHLTALDTLKISSCSKLDFPDNDHTFQGLPSLCHLFIEDIPKLVRLPEGLQHVSTLKTLSIRFCDGFITLPDWIATFTSLTSLKLSRCEQLKSLPEGMSSMSSLQKLNIWACRHLARRCRRETGEDWPKISHIPSIIINDRLINQASAPP